MKKRKMVAMVIALGYLLFSLISGQLMAIGRVFLFCVFALMLIIFNEEMSRYRGFLGGFKKITVESPPEMVEFMGWIILLFPFLAYLFLKISFG